MDDESDIRSTIVDILQDEGYSVTAASDGYEGLEVLKGMNPPPGLIILDLMMPNVRGDEFLKLRTQNLADIPVAYFSADSDILNKSKLAGIESLRKPVNFGEILSLVKKYCN